MDYFDNVKRSILYIEDNIKNDIRIDDMAKEAYFSPYHFLRIFSDLTGESPSAYLRKLRLTEAARDLAAGRLILETAIDYCFNSQEAFSKSFKKYFGITPGLYIRRGAKIEGLPRPEPNHFFIKIGERQMHKEPKIETWKEKKIIGYPYYGVNTRLGEMWERFDRYFGIYGKKPPYYWFMFNFGHNKEPWEFVYMPAIEVETLDKDMPMELVGKIIPEATWAMFHTEVNKIGEAIDFLHNKWLPDSGYELSINAELEIYMGENNPCCCYYSLPVRKK